MLPMQAMACKEELLHVLFFVFTVSFAKSGLTVSVVIRCCVSSIKPAQQGWRKESGKFADAEVWGLIMLW